MIHFKFPGSRIERVKRKKVLLFTEFLELNISFLCSYRVFEIRCVFSTWGPSPFWPLSGAATLGSTGLDSLLSPLVMGAVCVYCWYRCQFTGLMTSKYIHNNALFFLSPTLGAFNNPEALESFHCSSAHIQDYIHGIPLLPKQGLGAQSGT